VIIAVLTSVLVMWVVLSIACIAVWRLIDRTFLDA
jgi:hypothetical protein